MSSIYITETKTLPEVNEPKKTNNTEINAITKETPDDEIKVLVGDTEEIVEDDFDGEKVTTIFVTASFTQGDKGATLQEDQIITVTAKKPVNKRRKGDKIRF